MDKLKGVVPCCDRPYYVPAFLLVWGLIRFRAAYCRCCGEVTDLSVGWNWFLRLFWAGAVEVHTHECEPWLVTEYVCAD